MPELPEVQTTVNGLNSEVSGLLIKDAWTDYNSLFHAGKSNIKNPEYFARFKRDVVGAKITHTSRAGKNVLIHLSRSNSRGQAGKTILTHMKMTGHFLYGDYEFKNKKWQPKEKSSPLADPYNRHIHLVFALSNGKHLAFSDARKFAKIFVFDTENKKEVEDLISLGPDALSPDFTFKVFKDQISKRPNWKIKQALLDQKIIAGIGNIYSDEILWTAGVHPASIVSKIMEEKLKEIFKAIKPLLKRGISFGGDSDSDYRNIHGLPGEFQNKHNAYRKRGEPCPKKDDGTIERIVVAGRSTHFCPKHQIKFT